MDLLYIGDVKSKYESISTFSDATGENFSLLGGEVGEAVVYSLARNLLFCMNKSLFVANGGELTQHDLSQIASTQISTADSVLRARINELEALLESASDDNELLAQITSLNAQKTELNNQIASLRVLLDNAQSDNVDLAMLHTQISTLEAQLAEKVRIAEELRVENEELRDASTRSDDDVTRAIVL